MASYELVTIARDGKRRVASYASEDPLARGAVVRFKGRDRLVERLEEGGPPARLPSLPATGSDSSTRREGGARRVLPLPP